MKRRKWILFFMVILVALMPFSFITSKGQDANTDHSFALNAFYPSLGLISTYLGGTGGEFGQNIAIGGGGPYYIIGSTDSIDFPTKNAYDSTYGGDGDAFVAKFSYYGKLLWSTYLGGNDIDVGQGIALDATNNCYVTGWTMSSNFPTLNAYDNTYGGGVDYGDGFVAKFSADGVLLWSTYLGGSSSEYSHDIVHGHDGWSVIGTTWSSDFPTLNAYQSTFGGFSDAFIATFSETGSLLSSTFLGGNNADYANGIEFISLSDCYVIGNTYSDDFPTLNAYQSTYSSDGDVFVTRLADDGSLLWSTFLGGNGDDYGMGIDTTYIEESCYVTGFTDSSDFPTLNASDSTFNGGSEDAFVAKLSSTGALLWSTYLGGSEDESGSGIAVFSDGNCFVTGRTSSSNFPTMNAYDSTLNATDAFVTKFSPDGSLSWSTYLGGNDNDYGVGITLNYDTPCVTGWTYSSNFPIKKAYDSTLSGYVDAFITEIYDSTISPSSDASAYGFLGFIVVMSILVLGLRKRRN
jgi:hypothetical protein